MRAKNLLVSLVAIFALVFMVASVSSTVSAFGSITSVDVNGITGFNAQGNSGDTAAVFAGQTVNIGVDFTAFNTIADPSSAEDVRITARLVGEPGVSDTTERFDVLPGNIYSRNLQIVMPYDIDPSEVYFVEITVESNSVVADTQYVRLEVQRGSYEVQILSVDGPNQVGAGDTLPLDVVLKNRGRHDADDTYVKATITELGVSRTVYFGDLAPVDNAGGYDNEEDAVEGIVYLNVPQNVQEGLYTLEIEAYNADSSVVRTQKVFITSAADNSNVFTSSGSKTFSVGETATYTMTLVNSGNRIAVYNLVVDADQALDVTTDDDVVVVPAGSSKVVRFSVSASDQGKHDFTVNVNSESGATIASQDFTANVEGRSVAGNAAVLLTVVLAIVFVVLLIVLIVLLTRRPEKTENLGESYY